MERSQTASIISCWQDGCNKKGTGEEMIRCPWCESNPLLQSYHDDEWGKRPCSEQKHFEFLMLECAQAGLSWLTVLKRREAYRMAFAGFDPALVSAFGDNEIDEMLQNPGLIRNKKKLRAAIINAGAFMNIQREFGSFDSYLLSFFGGRPSNNDVTDHRLVPADTEVSRAISADMKARGFMFMGATVIYAHLQAAGIVDDHVNGCIFKANTFMLSAETRKLKAMQKVGNALHKADVRFCIGGSAMLFMNGLSDKFNDIDLLVDIADAKKAEAILLELGEIEKAKDSSAFATEVFRSYLVDDVGVDMMAGLRIRYGEQIYSHKLTSDSIADRRPVYGTMLPFGSLEEWCILYYMMPGKAHKAKWIKSHLKNRGNYNRDILNAMVTNQLPHAVTQWLSELIKA